MPSPDVTLVAPYPPPMQRHGGSSGVASYTSNLAHALHGEGAEVTVLAPREADSPAHSSDDGVIVERVFDRGPLALPQAARAAVGSRAPIVHLQHEAFLYGGASAMPGMLGGLAWLGRHRPTVVTLHQVVETSTVDQAFARLHRVSVPAPLARGALALLQGAVPRLADATVVLEDRFRHAVRDAVLLPHGVEERPEGTDRARARAALGIDDTAFVALCFGYLAPYKGLEAALDASTHLHDGDFTAGSRVRVVVAGGAHPRLAGRDEYGDRLRRTYGSSALFTGYVPDAEVHDVFAAADVVMVLYPRPFSSSGALALALAHHRPVLLSSGVAATLQAPTELVAPADPRELAGLLRTMAADPARRGDIATATRTLASGRSWPEVARSHLELYKGVTDVQPSEGVAAHA